jgi:hypothetical protein
MVLDKECGPGISLFPRKTGLSFRENLKWKDSCDPHDEEIGIGDGGGEFEEGEFE